MRGGQVLWIPVLLLGVGLTSWLAAGEVGRMVAAEPDQAQAQ